MSLNLGQGNHAHTEKTGKTLEKETNVNSYDQYGYMVTVQLFASTFTTLTWEFPNAKHS